MLAVHVVGRSGVEPLASDVLFSYPRRIAGRPRECEPTAALLAALLALFEDNVRRVHFQGGLVSFRSALDSDVARQAFERDKAGDRLRFLGVD
jgi:hypothetical protein